MGAGCQIRTCPGGIKFGWHQESQARACVGLPLLMENIPRNSCTYIYWIQSSAVCKACGCVVTFARVSILENIARNSFIYSYYWVQAVREAYRFSIPACACGFVQCIVNSAFSTQKKIVLRVLFGIQVTALIKQVNISR